MDVHGLQKIYLMTQKPKPVGPSLADLPLKLLSWKAALSNHTNETLDEMLQHQVVEYLLEEFPMNTS